jgi:hypothetical protein
MFEEKISLLKKIGCIKLTLGIEYGESDMLKFIGKGITTEQVEEVYKLLAKYDILAGGGMLSNFPQESFDSINKSFAFFKGLQKYGFSSNLFPSPVQVHPGTVLDRKYWQEKSPGFRWSRPFFCKRNLFLNASPFIPLWENVPTEKLLHQIIVAAFLNHSPYTVLFIVIRFFLKPDIVYLEWGDRLMLRLVVTKAVVIGFLRSPSMLIKIGTFILKKVHSKWK